MATLVMRGELLKHKLVGVGGVILSLVASNWHNKYQNRVGVCVLSTYDWVSWPAFSLLRFFVFLKKARSLFFTVCEQCVKGCQGARDSLSHFRHGIRVIRQLCCSVTQGCSVRLGTQVRGHRNTWQGSMLGFRNNFGEFGA